MNTARILKSAYMSELEIHNEGGQSWAGFFVSLLKLFKFDHLWDTLDSSEAQKQSKTLKHKGRCSYKNLYFDHNFAAVGHHSKLRTYIEFKQNCNIENYLDTYIHIYLNIEDVRSTFLAQTILQYQNKLP